MSELTDKLGFYFLVFQRTLNPDIIKCWIDGDERYELYKRDEVLNLCNALGYDMEVDVALRSAFDETSFWLWDVEDRKVRRLSSIGNEREMNIFNEMNKRKDRIQEINAFADINDRSGEIRIGWRGESK